MTLLRANLAMACAVVWLMSGSLLGGGEGMRIEELKVPDSVRNGSRRAVLDCVYTLNESEKDGLVVKWYFNEQMLVYQWIPNQHPQALGNLKGKLNLKLKASDDPLMVHRALEITEPTTELSGEYQCSVSSFGGEVSQSKKMIVYVAERSLKMDQEKFEEDKVKITCSAEGLYPEPSMNITSSDKSFSGPVDVNVETKNGLYDITASVTVMANIEQSTTFECVLRIPETDYVSTKSLPFTPNKNSGNRLSSSHAFAAAFTTALVSIISSRL